MTSTLGPKVDAALQELHALYEVLKRDADDFWTEERDHPDDRTRRAAIRSSFAFVEGMTFAAKQLVYSWEVELRGTLPWRSLDSKDLAFLALLREESYELDDQGPLIRPAKLRLASNVKFGCDSLAEMFRASSPIDTSSAEWQDLKAAIKIRDRLMHPRGSQDLAVTPNEALKVNKVYVWFHHAIWSVFKNVASGV